MYHKHSVLNKQTFQEILVLTFIEYVLSTRPLLFNMTKLLLERCNTHLLTPGRKSTTDQTTDTTKAHLGEAMSFVRVTYWSIVDGLFTVAEMTQR